MPESNILKDFKNKMKVVINNCPGEFSLSDEAVQRYVRAKGITLYAHTERCETVFSTKHKSKRTHKEDGIWLPKTDIPRNDDILIDIIQTMGKKAETIFSSLVIKDVENNKNWIIIEHDGKEEIVYLNN